MNHDKNVLIFTLYDLNESWSHHSAPWWNLGNGKIMILLGKKTLIAQSRMC